MSVLKAQLFELEKSAETLEKIIYKYLIDLQFAPDKEVARYEAKILRKLRALDELQDDIDATVAKLKEAGEWKPVSYAGKLYIYKPPKVTREPKPKRKQWKPRKEYPVEAPRKTPAKKQIPDREVTAARKPREVKPKSVRPPKAPKAPKPPKPKPTPKPRPEPKSRELQRAERGVYDAILDRQKVEGVFERQRIKDQQWAEEAQADLIRYADTSTADKGPQKRCQARIKLAAATERLNTIEERKEARYKELSERQAKYEAEVGRLLSENNSQV
jgi:hypothetical protein